MKILLTGANGLLGQNLVYELFVQGHTVVATGKGPCRFDYSGSSAVRYYELDITDPQHRKRLQELETGFDQIIHAAALTQVDHCELNKEEAYSVNVTAVKDLLVLFEPQKIPFLYVSTDFVFDGEKGNYTEEDETHPVNWYGQTKLEAENFVRNYAGPWSIARTCLVYGQVRYGTRSNIISWVKENLENDRPIKVVSDQWRTPTFVLDLVEGIKLMIEKKAKGIFHISGEEGMTPFDMAMQTALYFGLNKDLIEKVNASVFIQPGTRPPRTGFKINKAKSELGFQPIPFQLGLQLFSKKRSHKSI